MGSNEQIYTVTMSKKEVVAAVLPVQDHWLPLSNLDLLLPPVDVGVFFCYKKPKLSFGAMVNVLKKAMAQALVSYYPFAGEVVANSVGEPEIFCNNRGVEFYEAVADVELVELNLYNPDESVEAKLVPRKENGVFAVQVTELKCGGIVVACTFDHRIADAYSANMFLVSWAQTSQSEPISIIPSFRRSLLNPRRPAHVDPSIDNLYVPISSLFSSKNSKTDNNADEHHDDDDHLISRIYYVKKDELVRLQSLASANGYKRTKLEAFSAFLWQLIAKCASTNTKNGKVKMSKLGIVVDGRTRLSNGNDSMCAYFGNVLSIPYDSKKIDELVENKLSWVTNNVHELLNEAVTKEHFLGLIDWVEAQRPEAAISKIYTSNKEDGPAFVVSSGQRFPILKMDFGWGLPIFGSYHFPWGGKTGYVMPMPSPQGNGDWILYMHLFSDQLDFLEIEAAKFFMPLNWDDLQASA
ncbi:coniferyl alcohol acyltransferase-like [Mercurialis annua]|uniref:coniferyl alcohol acyltransferase-like n=1 Tax=Mercurialis annua TaxID=3986 RepID=UPI00215DDE79|nr:coniferyl alcohol acyltransferase-like [Mercurialis annua]